MMQLRHLLKKDYDEIKEYVIWEKGDKEEIELLAKSGLIPQLVSAKFTGEIQFYDINIPKCHITFLNNKVHELHVIATGRRGPLIALQLLITHEFDMKFFTKEFLRDFLESYKKEHGQDPDLKIVKDYFDESWMFDPSTFEKYDYINLYSEEMNIDIYVLEALDKTLLMEFFIRNANVDSDVQENNFLSLQN